MPQPLPARRTRLSFSIEAAYRMPPGYPTPELVGPAIDSVTSDSPQVPITNLEHESALFACRSYFLTKEFFK